jgi:hypothetical protein
MHRLTIHITDNDKFDKLVELDGLQPYAEALHNAIGDRDIPLYRNNRLLFIAKENNPLDFGLRDRTASRAVAVSCRPERGKQCRIIRPAHTPSLSVGRNGKIL